jgi:hypothetical protein
VFVPLLNATAATLNPGEVFRLHLQNAGPAELFVHNVCVDGVRVDPLFGTSIPAYASTSMEGFKVYGAGGSSPYANAAAAAAVGAAGADPALRAYMEAALKKVFEAVSPPFTTTPFVVRELGLVEGRGGGSLQEQTLRSVGGAVGTITWATMTYEGSSDSTVGVAQPAARVQPVAPLGASFKGKGALVSTGVAVPSAAVAAGGRQDSCRRGRRGPGGGSGYGQGFQVLSPLALCRVAIVTQKTSIARAPLRAPAPPPPACSPPTRA